MKQRFWIYRRDNGIFYLQDSDTNTQDSLRTRDEEQARRLLHAKNEAARQPIMNRQMARVYLSAADPAIQQRTWANVLEEVIATKQGQPGVGGKMPPRIMHSNRCSRFRWWKPRPKSF